MVTQCVQQVLHAANNSLLLTVADLLFTEQIGSNVKNTGAATGSHQSSFIKTATNGCVKMAEGHFGCIIVLFIDTCSGAMLNRM